MAVGVERDPSHLSATNRNPRQMQQTTVWQQKQMMLGKRRHLQVVLIESLQKLVSIRNSLMCSADNRKARRKRNADGELVEA